MSQALYRKWRPGKWEEVVGQQHVVQTLRNAVANDRVAHAYLFAGARGTGKTTVARLLAKAVNCLAAETAARPCGECAHCLAVADGRFLDMIEIDAASNTSVDDVRELRDKINFTPNQGKYKVYIIDEVHMLSTAAFNALLKTLEEPPPHAIFILTTTEIHKIPLTVLSRCQRHEFRRLPVDDIVGQLRHIAEEEKLSFEPEALTLIARQATGSFRDAISLLDQLSSTGQMISLGLVQNVLGTATSQAVLDIVDALAGHEPSAGLNAIQSTLDAGVDSRLLARQVVDYLRALLFVQMGNEERLDVTSDALPQLERHAKTFRSDQVLHLIRLFNTAATEVRGSWQPSLPLELALVESMEEPPAAPPAKFPPSSGAQKGGGQKESPASDREPKTGRKAAGETKDASHSGKKEKGVSEVEVREPTTPEQKAVRLEQVSKVWKQVCTAIKPQSSSLTALLNSCKLLEVKDGTLVLGFASELLCSKAGTPQNIELIRRTLGEAIGVNIPVRCVISSARKSAPPDVNQNGMVAAALKAGGEIVDIQE